MSFRRFLSSAPPPHRLTWISALAGVLLAGTTLLAHADILDKKVDAKLSGKVAEGQFGSILHAQSDLDRDGVIDLVVGSPAGPGMRGAVDVFKGGAAGLARQAMFHYEGQMDWAQVGSSVIGADVNGDGWIDLVVGAANQSGALEYNGAVLVFLGSPKGFPAQPSQTIEGPSTNSQFGWRILSLGDFDGDGKADVGITAVGAMGGRGAIYVHKGTAKGLTAKAFQTLSGSAPWSYFGRVSVSGDTNKDGIADLVVGAVSPAAGVPGMVWVYHGTRAGYSNVKTETLTSPVPMEDSEFFGDAVQLLGDADGDGHMDIAVAAPSPLSAELGSGRIVVFYGSATGLGTSGRSQVIVPREIDGQIHLGGTMLGDRDVDGDGYADLIVGASAYSRPSFGADFPGQIWIYKGGPTGLASKPDLRIRGKGNDELGTTLEVGDINGDGLLDLLSGSGWYSGREPHSGIVRVFLGAAADIARR